VHTEHPSTADFIPPDDQPAGSQGKTLPLPGAPGPRTATPADGGTADSDGPSTASEMAGRSERLTESDSTAGAPNPARSPFLTDAVPAIPGYLVEAEIARGGMGVVYRARDTALARDVAVKVLQDRYPTNSLVARRFVDEARITGQLQHPGVPPVHEFGTLPNGRPFLVMKLVKGRTLADLIADGRANRGSLVAVFEQVCQAVAYAHNHGVVHRDLKPLNVMVGAFGEVQVMDWGLAKLRTAARAESADATLATTFRDPRTEDEDGHTRAGSFLGTPAYMSPEQAIGAVDQIDERSDVFGLGAVLCAILTGEPPFVAATSESTRQLAAQKKVEPAFARLEASGAEPALVALCKRCLAGEREERLRNAGEVAAAVHGIRAEGEERARRAELDRVKAEGEKVAAELQAVEQRKRRRVQLLLAGFVILAAVGGGIAANGVQRQRDSDRRAADEQRADDMLAAERKQGEERFAAEQKRQADLREAKVTNLVGALTTADPAAVSGLLTEIAADRQLARPHLLRLTARPVQERPGLYARLALVRAPDVAAQEYAALLSDVFDYSLRCPVDELLLIVDHLDVELPLAPTLERHLQLGLDGWNDQLDPLRLAAMLARLNLPHTRWANHADAIAKRLVAVNALEADRYVAALRPLRSHLVPALLRLYGEHQQRLQSDKGASGDLVAVATGFDLAANVLAQYAADRPAELAEMALVADPRHYRLFAKAIETNKAAVVPLLKAELARKPPESVPVPELDAALEAHGKRRGRAAAVLVALGEAEAVWPVFAFPKDGDPTARSYLLQRLPAVGADPLSLMRRFDTDADVSAKRGLLVALGDFTPEVVPGAEREALAARLLALYREHPDPGLRGAIDWLLRQKWGKAKELSAIDAELAAASRAKVLARGLADVGVVPVGRFIPPRIVAEKRDWFVNGEGQTFAVVRGPVGFTMGSLPSEPGRIEATEPAHRKRISRTFAIATKEVTNAEFHRFRPKHAWVKRRSPGEDTPVVSVNWYDCAAYCNWLSEREGIPADQWCYEPNKGGGYGEGMRIKADHLQLTGYRLPTEAEWEYACRAGAATARYHGRGVELLPRYGWFLNNADERAWPVGQLRPNELGLFDALGNAFEWVEDPAKLYATGQPEDIEHDRFSLIDERMSRTLRGGSFFGQQTSVRAADRCIDRPGLLGNNCGFRPARTLP
jgi:serine/threonine protein kinase/formylglycine-generating enzyme required for sulfatase activity